MPVLREDADTDTGSNRYFVITSYSIHYTKLYELILIQKIPIDLSREFNLELEDKPNSYQSSIDLIADLNLLYDELEKCGIGEVAHVDVGRMKRILKIFGFHLAKLDIRQNSAYHDKALKQLVTASRITSYNVCYTKLLRRIA